MNTQSLEVDVKLNDYADNKSFDPNAFEEPMSQKELYKKIKKQAKEMVKNAKACGLSGEERKQIIKLAKLTAREMIANAKLEDVIKFKDYNDEKKIEDIKANAERTAKEICDHDISIGKANRTAFSHTLLEFKRKILKLKTKFKAFVAKILGVNLEELNEKIKQYNYSEMIKNFSFFQHTDGSVSGMSDVKMCISEHLYSYKELISKWYHKEYSLSKLVRVLIAKLTNLSSDVINAIINSGVKEEEVVEPDHETEDKPNNYIDVEVIAETNTNKGFNGLDKSIY